MNGAVRLTLAALVLPAVLAAGCSSGGGRSWKAGEVLPPAYEGSPRGSFPNWVFPPVPDAEDVVIAEYPSVDAFVQMLRDPDYREAVKHRQAAVEDSRLIRMEPLTPGADFGSMA